jgi:hypothetical protein
VNPLEIHKHVARSSGREVGDVSPLAAELSALAYDASQAPQSVPSHVSDFEQTIEVAKEESRDYMAEFKEGFDQRISAIAESFNDSNYERILSAARNMLMGEVKNILKKMEDPQEADLASELAAYGFGYSAIADARAGHRFRVEAAMGYIGELEHPEILELIENIVEDIYE